MNEFDKAVMNALQCLHFQDLQLKISRRAPLELYTAEVSFQLLHLWSLGISPYVQRQLESEAKSRA